MNKEKDRYLNTLKEKEVLDQKKWSESDMRNAELITERFLQFVPLTKLELEVFDRRLPCMDLTFQEIADDLSISTMRASRLMQSAKKKIKAFKNYFKNLILH